MRIRVHNKKTGATSILVIVLMVILIVLGLAILTTAQSGVRLAQKKELWLQSYYSLEGQMAQVQATFMEAFSPLALNHATDPITADRLKTLLSKVPEATWALSESGPNDYLIAFDVKEERNQPHKHLTTTYLLSLPPDGAPTLVKTAYRQWQEDHIFENLPGFEDPLTETPEFNFDTIEP